ncbi:hypothetical protein EC9_48310 [Rosistilla ulvae]|uniref:DinB-like domain-containing protein n=1 Tax=Rosistilla ulvae TaxID=1930277 RepID=A0A517M750_9BACT|nr:DinB family protein [Rosistilla ulvae]QDS90617.1 hypothetical protein EC9_48310 [Rosistilla ulvae]
MSNFIGNMIADSLSRGINYADSLVKDLPADQFARFAPGKEGPIVSNHPAFIVGHLSIYAPRVVDQLGQDATAYQPTEAENALFSPAAKCQDDPNGLIYPGKEVLLDRFTTVYQAALTTLRNATDDQFMVPNPAEGRLRELFPTLGGMHAFYTGGHFMLHMGQLSAWRRMMGMAPA